MKHKVSDLEGALLDAAVAKAEGRPFAIDGYDDERLGTRVEWVMAARPGFQGAEDLGRRRVDRVTFSPSTDWALGGPIIERERIVFWWTTRYIEPSDPKDFDIPVEGWNALHPNSKGLDGYYRGDTVDVGPRDGMFGPTPLIAAMRAYCASKFGDEVELP